VATSVFFDFFNQTDEQELLSDLVAESIHVNGHDMYYLPRTVENRDAVFSEAEYASFDSHYFFEFFIKTSSQMGGEGALLSKFGVELRDELVLTVAMKTFREEVTDRVPAIVRPREGDTIFIPMIGSLFTIKYVDKKAFFYQLGGLQAWDLTVELYESQSAVFNTGLPFIDEMYAPFTNDITERALTTEDGFMITEPGDGWVLLYTAVGDPDVPDLDQNDEFEEIADEEVIDWAEEDPFSESGRF
jgi:hypothetical protein